MKKTVNKWLLLFASIFLMTAVACSNSTGENNNPEILPESTTEETPEIITNFPAGITTFEGSHDFGNWGSHLDTEEDSEGHKKILMRFICNGFSEGDQIQITHKESDLYTEKAILEICANSADWNNSMLTTGALINATRKSNSESDILPRTKKQTTAYTLTAQDASSLNNSEGFIILGCGLTVEKIVIKSQKTLTCNFLKNGWQRYEYTNSSYPPDIINRNGFEMVQDLTECFDLSFIPWAVDLKKTSKDIIMDEANFVKYRFYYTYNSNTKKLMISKTSKISYPKNGNTYTTKEEEISEAKNYTLSLIDDKLKFDSLPVTELSDLFYTDTYYSCPVKTLKLSGTYTTTVNNHMCELIIKSDYFVFENPFRYFDEDVALALLAENNTYENLFTFDAHFGSVSLDNNSIILITDYWKYEDTWMKALDGNFSASYNQDSITFNQFMNSAAINCTWTRQ